jgi:pimeloyl-ACP methyl ester carboxylesterase
VLAGDSLGGYLALAAARRAPRLAGVVAGGCTFDLGGWRSLGARLTDLPVAAATAVLGPARVEAAMLAAFAALTRDRELAAEVGGAGLRLAARLESVADLAHVDLAGTIRSLGVPVTFVNGSRDLPIAWGTERYAALARSGRAVRIAGAGHGVFSLAPRPVAAEIAAVLACGVSGSTVAPL